MSLEHGGRTFYGDNALETWVKILLYICNTITTIMTICNVIYLRRRFPAVNEFFSQKSLKLEQSLEFERQLESDPAFIQRSTYRHRIQRYFYVVSVIPLCVSICGHYGARFPEQALWIFPGMNIAIGIGFLSFMRMMVMSCEGWEEVKKILIKQPDECVSLKNRPFYKKCLKKCCCNVFFLKENAYEGLKQRILFCSLILVKPFINYIAAVFEFNYHTDDKDQKIVTYTFSALVMFTTFIPLNVMRSFHGTLLPYTRLRRSGVKRLLIAFLAPVCQIQEFVVEFAFGHWDLPGFEGIGDVHRWCCAYGMILVVEMVFISSVITFVAYRPRDLRLWEYSESFLVEHGYDPKTNHDDFMLGAAGTMDNVDEHVPDRAYVKYNATESVDFSINASMQSLNASMLSTKKNSHDVPLIHKNE